MSLRHQHPWMLQNISARTLFRGGLMVLPAFLLQSSLAIRVIQVVFFGSCAVLAGKRLQWAYFLTVVTVVTAFHLIIPAGPVLATAGPLRITAGALHTGLFKSVTLLGMVFISLVAVRADLRLPGTVGALTGKVFWSFEQIMDHRHALDVRRPLESGDALMMELHQRLVTMGTQEESTIERKGTAARSTPAGYSVVWVVVILNWVSLLL